MSRRKYSNARALSLADAVAVRIHAAELPDRAGTPCSAAYSSSVDALVDLALAQRLRAGAQRLERRDRRSPAALATGGTGTAPAGVAEPSELDAGAGNGTATVAPSGERVPSKLTAGDKPKASASKPMLKTTSDVRIARLLRCPAGMGHGALARRSHLLGVFPQISGGELRASSASTPCARRRARPSSA